jgi:hypothetical protein
MSGAAVRTLLIDSAQSFAGGPQAGCGAGILDAAAALVALDAMIDRERSEEPNEIEDG